MTTLFPGPSKGGIPLIWTGGRGGGSYLHLWMNCVSFLASCLIWPIFLENNFKSGLVTPLGVCQPPPPCYALGPKLNLVSRVHFSINIADFLASSLIWPIFLENNFKSVKTGKHYTKQQSTLRYTFKITKLINLINLTDKNQNQKQK